MRHVCLRPILLAVLYSAACLAQAQQVPSTARDFCVKVAHGKNLEFESYLHNISVRTKPEPTRANSSGGAPAAR